MMTKYVFIFLFITPIIFGQQKPDWKLIVDQDDLKVYRGTKQKNSIYPIRGDFYTNHTPAEIVAVLLDIPTKPKWLPKLTKTKLVKKFNSTKWIEYAQIDVPWPCRNRDIVFELNMDINPDFSKVIFRLKSVDHSIVYNKSNIRAIVYDSTMVITYDAKTEKSFIQSESFVDPKGYIPRWIVNLFQKRQTINIAKALVEQLDKKLYADISESKLRQGPN